jgi:hypothetical protein
MYVPVRQPQARGSAALPISTAWDAEHDPSVTIFPIVSNAGSRETSGGELCRRRAAHTAARRMLILATRWEFGGFLRNAHFAERFDTASLIHKIRVFHLPLDA